jgi:hypothetical protein
MIVSFRDRHTEEFWRCGTGKAVPAGLRRVAMRKLKLVSDAAALDDLAFRPAIIWKDSREIAPDSTAFALTADIACAFAGGKEMRTK